MLVISGRMNNSSNIQYDEENNFSIIPDDIRIWGGNIPWDTGDLFPPKDVKERASKYKTFRRLYNCDYDGIFDCAYNMQSMNQDPFGYSIIYDLSLSLPDFKNCTESWVDLMAANPPRIDGESDDVDKLSSLLTNSNFNQQFKSIIRGDIVYGNRVLKVTKLSNGEVVIANMKEGNWIPFMDEEDFSHIKANIFFNIVNDSELGDICEFIIYEDNGAIKKKVFQYNKASEKLGELINEEEEESFLGESPIVVFTENGSDGSIIGSSSFPLWESSIASSIRAYNNLMTMLERAKEAMLVIPNYAGETDENSDQRMLVKRGAIEYAEGQDHDVSWVTANLDIQNAIEVYMQTLRRLARDTDLGLEFFGVRDKTSTNFTSAKALRTAMFKTELKAKSKVSSLELNTKRLIVKFAKAHGMNVTEHEFSLVVNTGFINDEETQMKIIQARCGDIATMTREDAIAAYDNISMKRARAKASEINGIKIAEENNEELDVSSGESDNIGFTTTENTLDINDNINNDRSQEVAFLI